MRFNDRHERERYMDGLERQMEQKREEIGRSLDEIQGSGRRTALKRLQSSLPSFLHRTSVRDAEGERKAATERPDGEGLRNWWQFWR
jgi:hypothetical protein